MAYINLGALSHFVHQHLPHPHLPDLTDATHVAAEAVQEAAALTANGVTGTVQAMAQPDYADSPWLWDHDPFEPGLQLVTDPLAEVAGNIAAVDVSLLDLPDLPDDGLDAVLG